MSVDKYKLLYNSGTTYNIPLYLNASADELGVMVGFDGDIEQVEQLVNFTYTQTGNTITVTNSVKTDKLRDIVNQTYMIDFGDGSISGITADNSSLIYTYMSSGTYDVKIKFSSPWEEKETIKKITVPEDLSMPNPLGTFSGVTLPSGVTQDYLYDYDYTSGYTGYTEFKYIAFGKSKIDETYNYGSSEFTGETGVDNNGNYSGYTIDNFYYRDYEDGYTMVTGTTSGFTKEEVFNTVLTRNEHFIGFVDEPTIYSDIFIERGRLGVMEKNFRLSEVDSIGELNVYGNKFFNITKQ